MSFLDGLQTSDKLLLFGGVGLATIIVLDRLIDRDEEAPAPRRRARAASEDQRDKAIERAEARLKALEAKAEDARQRAAEWERRAKEAQGHGATKTATKAKRSAKKAEAVAEKAEQQAETVEEKARRIERGEYTPSEIRDLMASGALRMRNPDLLGISTKTPSGELDKAKALSTEIHGTDAEVLELSARERQPLPRYVTVLGELPELSYEPDEHSKRAGFIYDHATGDRGPFAPKAGGKAYVAINPRNRRPVLIFNSPTRLKAGQLNG